MSGIKSGLSNNQLKLIAMVAMLCDHVGRMLFPQVLILQIIGRISFPIFAYMIAEGCRHTKNRGRYLLLISALAFSCQAVFYIFSGSLYMNILITFVLSITTIFCWDNFWGKRDILSGSLFVLHIAVLLLVCVILPVLLTDTDYWIDYGVFGVLLTVAIYYAPKKLFKMLLSLPLLIAITFYSDSIQWFSILALPLLTLYNGERGKYNIKWLFYIFYPVHLLAIQLIDWLVIRY